jgi:hypothetical protein
MFDTLCSLSLPADAHPRTKKTNEFPSLAQAFLAKPRPLSSAYRSMKRMNLKEKRKKGGERE